MLYNCSTLEKELITEIVKISKLLSLRCPCGVYINFWPQLYILG